MICDSLSDVLCFHDLYTFERYWLGISQNVVQFGFDTSFLMVRLTGAMGYDDEDHRDTRPLSS